MSSFMSSYIFLDWLLSKQIFFGVYNVKNVWAPDANCKILKFKINLKIKIFIFFLKNVKNNVKIFFSMFLGIRDFDDCILQLTRLRKRTGKNTLETSGEDVKLHSKRVEKM